MTFLRILSAFSLLLFLTHLFPNCILKFIKKQNLKSKYNCKWALVTGGSSGIGGDIATELAKQGINIVIVSKEHDKLVEYQKSLVSQYNIECRIICVDLCKSKESCEIIFNQCKDINLNLLVCNAGYLTMEGFHQSDISEKLAMFECTVSTTIRLVDHFYKLMIANKMKGGIVIISSSASVCPSPFSVMYGSSRSFLSGFAQSLSIESKIHGIDVLAVQPGLVHTNLFNAVPKHLIFKFLNLMGSQKPSDVTNVVFKSLGRFSIMDSGLFALISSLSKSLLGINLMIVIISFICRNLPDFSNYRKIKI
ncbi:hypothetical protein DLAC_01076 [Tieghemostelium lacteum]|uniref:Short-chain dehydrogenase/reductase (SDR) family protein n=1 Tax=Tieghemostelium lacteum TaxID=361077 RepID=A0A152A878_TIELA|nr:hypothetical protein DLAC_01076 [Tieghemostelium lacteum]|eukprot:KYR02247.1 hypothetical protein DLAC_01076 [Tieghemostelium lacteum]